VPGGNYHPIADKMRCACVRRGSTPPGQASSPACRQTNRDSPS
jgi:hypothetical protein